MREEFGIRIGKNRRLTLSIELADLLGADTGDYLVLNIEDQTFRLERDGSSASGEKDKAKGASQGVDEGSMVIVSPSERSRNGKFAYRTDVSHLRQTVATYFGGLGVSGEELTKELAKLDYNDEEAEELGDEETRSQSPTDEGGEKTNG